MHAGECICARTWIMYESKSLEYLAVRILGSLGIVYVWKRLCIYYWVSWQITN